MNTLNVFEWSGKVYFAGSFIWIWWLVGTWMTMKTGYLWFTKRYNIIVRAEKMENSGRSCFVFSKHKRQCGGHEINECWEKFSLILCAQSVQPKHWMALLKVVFKTETGAEHEQRSSVLNNRLDRKIIFIQVKFIIHALVPTFVRSALLRCTVAVLLLMDGWFLWFCGTVGEYPAEWVYVWLANNDWPDFGQCYFCRLPLSDIIPWDLSLYPNCRVPHCLPPLSNCPRTYLGGF